MKRVLLFFCLMTGLCGLGWGQTQNKLQLAGRYMQAGQADKALSLYEELYKQDPQIFVYQGYLQCLQGLGKYDEAEKLIRKQLKVVHVPVLVKVDLAQNYLLQNNTKKASSVLQEITDKTDFRQPGLSVVELAENIVNKTRLYEPAIKVYLKARTQENTPEGGLKPYTSELANLYRLNGQYAEMLDEYISLMHFEGHDEEVYSRLQALLAGGDSKKNTAKLMQLIGQKAQLNPDDKVVQNLFIWALLQEKDFEAAVVQARAYTNRFNDKGQKWYQTVRTVRDNRQYVLAQKEYENFISHTSQHPARYDQKLTRNARVDLLNLYFQQLEQQKVKDSLQVERIKKDYKKLFEELGNDPETFGMYRNLARIYAYYSGQKDSAQQLLQKALGLPGFNAHQKAQLKIDLADILLFFNKVWDATLLYSQVEKDFKQDAVGFYAKLQNARLSYYIGEFEWARSQLEVLRAATSKLIANDAMELSLLIKEGMNPDSAYDGLALMAQADLLIVRHLYGPALEKLDEILTMPMEGALFDEVYLRKAKVYLTLDSVGLCLDYLRKIYADDSDELLVDDALFMAGGLMQLRAGIPIDPETEFLKPSDFPPVESPVWGPRTEARRAEDRAAAMLLYQRLFTDFKSSALAPLARQRYRLLRGN